MPQPYQPPYPTPAPHVGAAYFLTDVEGIYYTHMATVQAFTDRSVTLIVERIKSEAMSRTKRKAEPQALNRKPFAHLELRMDGSIHAWFGELGQLINGSDRNGYVHFGNPKQLREHARFMEWLHGLWGCLLPGVRVLLDPWEPEQPEPLPPRRGAKQG